MDRRFRDDLPVEEAARYRADVRMPPSSISLLHLSDVHFRKKKVDGTYDVDNELRNELELSVTEIAEVVQITGVVVTGDIAFAGDGTEFEAARLWLKKLALLARCPEEAVWTVCGNHDVDRVNVIEKSQMVQLLQRELRSDVLRLAALQADVQAAATLFSPIANYNDFAIKFGCDFGPDRLVWQQDLELNDGSKLRLVGLNSTLTSCKLDDAGQRLVLGDMSHAILREPGVAYATLCHHPPDWLLDHDQVTSLLNTKTRLQLYGHKHMPRIERINDSLRVTAGAIHPDRTEKEWEPRFNVISLQVATTGVARTLDVTINALVWSKATRKFTKDTADPMAGVPISIPLESWIPPTPRPTPPAVSSGGSTPSHDSMGHDKRFVYRFLTLPYHERIGAANALDLLRDEDKGVTDRVLFERILARAAASRKLGALWQEVESRHTEHAGGPNPYEGR